MQTSYVVGGEAKKSSSSSSSSSQPCSSFNACFLSPFLSSDRNSHNNNNNTSNSRVIKNDELLAATSSSLHPYTQFTNHESLPPLQHSYHNFIKAFPQFSTTFKVDQIRSEEYNHLNLSISNTCFDYNGYSLFSYSQQHQTSFASSSSSLPHLNLEQSFFDVTLKSMNLQSQLLYGCHQSELETRIKERIMTFLNISESDYSLVFIANEVSAFKLVADSFQFQQKGELLTVYDHNSEALETMIESCKKQGVNVLSAEFTYPNLGIEWRKLKKMVIKDKRKGSSSSSSSSNGGLFVFPLYSRVTGAPYSYVWMSMAQENGWRVLLDVCALRPKEMDTLGMSMFKPDFMVCSFYKVFGDNPSGFGCLFVKKSSICALKDSGNAASIGIVSLIPAFRQSTHDSQLPEEEIVEQTQNNEGLEIDCRGLDHADSVGLILISSRSRYLVNWLVNALMSLQHPNHEKRFSLIRIYGPKVNTHRGPSLAFNIFDWKGEKVDPALVQKLADRSNISLSKSFLKNIRFLNQEERQWALETKAANEVEILGRPKKRRGPEDFGIFVVTATLGFLTNFEDAYRLWAFVSRFLDADFVEKEKWRYIALNQKTMEV